MYIAQIYTSKDTMPSLVLDLDVMLRASSSPASSKYSHMVYSWTAGHVGNFPFSLDVNLLIITLISKLLETLKDAKAV